MNYTNFKGRYLASIERTSDLIDVASGPGREPMVDLPSRPSSSNSRGKRAFDTETNTRQRPQNKKSHSTNSDPGSWQIIDGCSRVSTARTHIKVGSQRKDCCLILSSDITGKRTNVPFDGTDVEEGIDSSTPETSVRGSKPLVMTSHKSEVNDDHLRRSDVSMARAHVSAATNSDIGLTNLNAINRPRMISFAVDNMSTVLVGMGTQFTDSSSFRHALADDWISSY